jgi:brefeldin A-inhibited guanine nucleotide-exchange protein
VTLPRLLAENDTLARIGTTCFQQLLENNVRKLSVEKWERIVTAFVQLFQSTLAHMLFDPNLRSEKEPRESPAYLTANGAPLMAAGSSVP